MKKGVIALVIFSLVVFGAAAETVMVAVNEGSPPHENESGARYYLSAAEAGAMEVLFDAGHIVFNAGTYRLEESEAREKRYEVRTMARNGGAGYALHIEVEFDRPDPDTVRPRTATYTMMDIARSRILKSGSVEVQQNQDTTPEERTFRAGRAIAESILNVWTTEESASR